MNFFSKFFGIILHPVLMCLIGVFIVVEQSTKSSSSAMIWTFISAIFALIVGLFVLLGVVKGFFNNFDVSNRKQRIILYPFVVVVVILFGLFVFLINGPEVLILASILFAASLILLDIINSKIKASIHVASVASLATGFVITFGISYLWVYFFVFLSAYARIVGKRHTKKETIVGALCGVVLTILGIFIVKSF